MIDNTSENNLDIIRSILASSRPRKLIAFDYPKHISALIDFILESIPSDHKLTIAIYTNALPGAANLKGSDTIIEKAPWTIFDLLTFLLGRSSVSFAEHTPVYEEDGSRLGISRVRYASGPLWPLANRFMHIPAPQAVKALALTPVLLLGIILQAVAPSLRPTKGTLTHTTGNIQTIIHFDGGPEKDHYGESPLIHRRINQLKQDIAASQERPIGFLIGSGPRELYINTILDFEDTGELNSFFILARDLYKAASQKVTTRRANATFYAGSNVSRNKKIIYSEHCLSIGAGKKELWHYSKL